MVLPVWSLSGCVIPVMLHILYLSILETMKGRDSSFGIETRYELDGPGIESRWGARFSALGLSQPPTMLSGSFPGGKAAGVCC